MRPEDLFIGCHLSAAKGWEAMGKDAFSIGATTFAFFTRNPRGGNAKALDELMLQSSERCWRLITLDLWLRMLPTL